MISGNTEMTEHTGHFPTLDPVAFACALVLSPLVVALIGFRALFIPVIPVVFGALPSLIFGTPLLMRMVTHYPMKLGIFALVGPAAQALFSACFLLVLLIRRDPDVEVLRFMTLWGFPFAALW
jgi:hypothetical protein